MSNLFLLLALCMMVLSVVGLAAPGLFKNKKTGIVPKRIKLFGMFLGMMFAFFVLFGVTSDNTESVSDETAVEAQTTDTQKEEPKKNAKEYSDGIYLVGDDIESGLYRVHVTSAMNMGYIERSKDVSMDSSDIIANIVLTGDGYVEILDTDAAVKLQGVKIEKTSLETLEKAPQKEAGDGIYLVGYDLAPGTYKVEVTDTTTGMGYVERAKRVSMGTNDIIANEIIQGPSYVKIKESDFAVRLQGVKISLKQ